MKEFPWMSPPMPIASEICRPDGSNSLFWRTSISPGGPWLPLAGGTMRGPLYLYADATQPMEAVPLSQLEDMLTAGGVFVDAPTDGRQYARQDGDWEVVAVDGGEW